MIFDLKPRRSSLTGDSCVFIPSALFSWDTLINNYVVQAVSPVYKDLSIILFFPKVVIR